MTSDTYKDIVFPLSRSSLTSYHTCSLSALNPLSIYQIGNILFFRLTSLQSSESVKSTTSSPRISLCSLLILLRWSNSTLSFSPPLALLFLRQPRRTSVPLRTVPPGPEHRLDLGSNRLVRQLGSGTRSIIIRISISTRIAMLCRGDPAANELFDSSVSLHPTTISVGRLPV